jgi:hypothetical protein
VRISSITIAIGRFTTTDEIAFKAAGREWARSGHFAAPELTGFATVASRRSKQSGWRIFRCTRFSSACS